MDEALTSQYESFLAKMDAHFRLDHGRPYTDQDIGSMNALASAVLLWRPAWILEVGTGHGGSTYAMLEAIKYATPALPPPFFQTADRNPVGFQHLQEITGPLSGVKFVDNIGSVELPKVGPGFVFWDAHDDQSRVSEEFPTFLSWPGPIHVIVHDCYMIDKSFRPAMPDARLRVTTVAHDGSAWSGRAELITFLEICRDMKAPLYCTAAGLMFAHTQGD